MTKPIEKVDKLKGKTFLSGQAGRFSKVPQRTVQNWTERKFLSDPGTEGTGKRRQYSILNCIEIGIIKTMANLGVHYSTINEIMGVFRRNENLLKALREDYYFYFLNMGTDGQIAKHYGMGFNEPELKMKDKITDRYEISRVAGPWMSDTFRPESAAVLTLNITMIAENILSKI